MEASTQTKVPLNFGWRRRLPIILQTETIECGLACLVMIATYYGRRCDLATIRRQFPLSLNGTTLARLIEIAAAQGMQSRPLRLEPEDIDQLQLPCIVHWDMEHYVVLWRITRRGAVIHDPVRGRRELSRAEFADHFTGVALEVQPAVDFTTPPPSRRVGIFALTGRLVGLKRVIVQIGALALLLELFTLIGPLFVQMVTDQVLPYDDHQLLQLLGIGFFLMVLIQTVIGAIRSWSVTRLGSTFEYSWTVNVFGHLLKLPQSFFERRQLGDISNRFSSIEQIQKTLTARFIEGVLDGLMAALTLGMMLLYSPMLTAITAITFLAYTIIRAVSFGWLHEAQHEQLMATATQQSHFLEVVRGMQAIRLNNKASVQAARYANKTVDAVNRGIAVQRLNIVFEALKFFVFNGQRVLILWVGALLALDQQLSAGMLIAFFVFSYLFTTRASALIDYGVELRMLRLHGDRLSDIILAEPEADVEPANANEPLDDSVRLIGIRFRYDEHQSWLLDGCELHVRQSESVAITGASGCGKTTLVKLLLGLADPQEGMVLVGERDIRGLGKRRLRDIVSAVMQDDQLFTGSIEDNISMFDEKADRAAIEAAACAASVHDDIVALPMGYYTLIGDMGSSLSGGQRQRIVLARALYKMPRILVLDEATSHLDVEREQLVNESIRRLDITRIVIAHRPETIASADRVLEMRDGRLFARDPAVPLPRRSAGDGRLQPLPEGATGLG
ncbi:MAG: peptidase domain-containing ABC transporter [Luteimonas sp.]